MDIENVLEFSKSLKNLEEKKFILVGHSLGSAPTVHIASINSTNNLIRAVILISPIASSKKFFEKINEKNNNIGLEKIDVFCNIKKIQEVKCPVLLIHGRKDEIIPFSQSEEMKNYIKIKHEWFPKNGDHSNILTKYRTKFYLKCNLFLDNLFCFEKKRINSKNSLNQSFGEYNSNKNKTQEYCEFKSSCYKNINNKLGNGNNGNNPFDAKKKSYISHRISYNKIGVKSQAYETQIDDFDFNNFSDEIDYNLSSDLIEDNIVYCRESNNKYQRDFVSSQIFVGLNGISGDEVDKSGKSSDILKFGTDISDQKFYIESYGQGRIGVGIDSGLDIGEGDKEI